MRFPGLGRSPQFKLDEEQMCARTPGPPALLLPFPPPSSTVLSAQGTDSLQMGWPLSWPSSDSVRVSSGAGRTKGPSCSQSFWS